MDRAKLPRTRLEAIDFYSWFLGEAAEKGPEHLRQAKRWLARNDLFFLLTYVCKRKDINRDWLFDRCREVEHEPDERLDLWAREHYKSTILTFGLTLQDILASHGEEPEARYGGIELTFGIFSFNRPIAKAFLRQIKQECEQNEELRGLFPDVIWGNARTEAPKWSEDEGLVFRRKSNPKEATVEAWGLVDGQPTSKHYWRLVYDDVVTESSVTETLIPKTTSAWELSTNLGTEGGAARYIGTRYAAFDTYHTMMERGIRPRVYPCTSDGSEDWSKSVLMKPETLAAKRRKQGPYTFGAQMLLNPLADKSQGFREEWLRYWPCRVFDGMNFYILVDPASAKKKGSDWTAMWVIGVAADGNFYVCDVVHDRLNLKERADRLFALHRKWKPQAVAYERYGKDADIEHLQYVMEQSNYRFDITEVAGSMAKEDRIRRLVPYFEAGRIWLPESGLVRQNYEGAAVDVIRTFIDTQYITFPVSQFDDLLDGLSRLCDLHITLPLDDRGDPELPAWMQDLELELEDEGAPTWMSG